MINVKKAFGIFGVMLMFSMLVGVVLASKLNEKSQEIELRNQEQRSLVSAKSALCNAERTFANKSNSWKTLNVNCSESEVMAKK